METEKARKLKTKTKVKPRQPEMRTTLGPSSNVSQLSIYVSMYEMEKVLISKGDSEMFENYKYRILFCSRDTISKIVI